MCSGRPGEAAAAIVLDLRDSKSLREGRRSSRLGEGQEKSWRKELGRGARRLHFQLLFPNRFTCYSTVKKLDIHLLTLVLCVCVLVAQLCLILCDPLGTVAHQDPLSMEFSRQEYWSGLPCLPPGDLSDPGIEPGSPALQADSLLSEPPGKLNLFILIKCYNDKILQKSHKSLPVLAD